MDPNTHRIYWLNKLKEGARAFNAAQDRLPHGEWINLDGADLSAIDIRGCCFKRATLFNACFANEGQIHSARLSDPLMDDKPWVLGEPPPKPTNSVHNFADYRRIADTRSSSNVLATHRDDAAHGRN